MKRQRKSTKTTKNLASSVDLLQEVFQSAQDELEQMETQRDSLKMEIAKAQQEYDEMVKRQQQELDEMKRKATEELEQDLEEMREERRQWQQIEAKARTVSSSAPHKVKLKIGGQSFITSIDTLTNEKHTFFSGLFSSHFNVQHDNDDGEVFIDRDPLHFSLILNHMRGVDVSALIAELKRSDLSLLKQEVDFYQIESLVKLLRTRQISTIEQWNIDMTQKHRDLQVTKNEEGGSTVIRKSEMDVAPASVLGDRGFSIGVHKWRVRIDQEDNDNDGWLGIGVCKLSDLTPYITSNCNDGYPENRMYGKISNGHELSYGKHSRGKRKWSDGTVVEVTLHCDAGTLIIDDCIINVPSGTELYPVFILTAINNQCTLLPSVE